MHRAATDHRRGFSLLEMSLVVIITAILAMLAAPSLSVMGEARHAAAADEVERILLDARARALAAGRPVGVRIDVPAQTLETIEILNAGDLPGAATDPLGQPSPAVHLGSLFPGATLDAVSVHAPGSDGATIWFAFDGTPQARTGTGSLVGALATDATLSLSGGRTLTIHAGSGAITR
ncbi:MAG: prepilin-type N-terminal cleavage/methylation domain-containing protein [Planctomycetota bacterium]|nr:prepilin-type N-terminal cleavage/methylation domain-containing protein [Planctomycetota bacterium]